MISTRGDSFCLIEFDMSVREVVQTNVPVLKHSLFKSLGPALRMFSVVQIALVAFQLDSNLTRWKTRMIYVHH